jgi:hypothetical protein
MSKSLGLIAGLGFGLALIFFVLAAMVSPNVLRELGRAGQPQASSAPGVKQFAWDGDDRLQIDMPAKVTLMPGGPPTVIVRGDQDLVQQVSLNHGKLSSDDDDDCFIPFFCGDHRHTLTVELHGVQLRELRVNGVAQVDMGHLDQDRLTLRLSGAGKVEGEGRLDDLDISISGAGDASFGGLAVARARVTLSGVGNAEISPSQEADVTISGVGNVRLDTKPASLIQHVSGVGGISGPGSEGGRERHRNDAERHGNSGPVDGAALGREISAEVQAEVRAQHIGDKVAEKMKQKFKNLDNPPAPPTPRAPKNP